MQYSRDFIFKAPCFFFSLCLNLDFEQLKKDVCCNRGLIQKIKAIFAKKK